MTEFNHLRELESRSIYILREAYANFRSLCMLWSIGKDSTVMLWLTRKAFFGHVPFLWFMWIQANQRDDSISR